MVLKALSNNSNRLNFIKEGALVEAENILMWATIWNGCLLIYVEPRGKHGAYTGQTPGKHGTVMASWPVEPFIDNTITI
jgi:hypothetical protein